MLACVKRLEIPIPMNNPNDPNQHFDDDIAELFDRQALEVPVALDDRIRSMAKAELEQSSDLTKPRKAWTSRYAPVFATAAVMILAIALVPMLVDQSKPLSEPTTAAIEPMAAAPTETASSAITAEANAPKATAALAVDQGAEKQILQEEVVQSAAEERVLKRKRNSLEKKKSVAIGGSAGALEAQAQLEMAADSNAEGIGFESAEMASSDFADTAVTLNAPSGISALTANYRVSQEDWIDEINRLFEADQHGKFLYELTLFKRQYPDFDLSNDLSADALKLDSSVGEQ